MDPWQRQRALGRTTIGWAAVSVLGGIVAMRRRNPWWRAFGQQHLGWGLVDVVIVVVAARLQARRMARAGNAYAPAVLERERRVLRKVLLANAAADAGYVVTGAVLARRTDPRARGAGAAIAIQGAFLLAHDGFHAARSAG